MYTIYIHRFPNGKVYVGCTGLEPKVRFGKNGNGYRTQERMWSAICKYGWNNIIHEILDQTNDRECASDLEQRYIAEYDSKNPEHGYNTYYGGLGLMSGEVINPGDIDNWDL